MPAGEDGDIAKQRNARPVVRRQREGW